jgi:hypothetical protein
MMSGSAAGEGVRFDSNSNPNNGVNIDSTAGTLLGRSGTYCWRRYSEPLICEGEKIMIQSNRDSRDARKSKT